MEDDAEMALYFTAEDGVVVADIRAWGMWLAAKADSSGSLSLCKDGTCSESFCVWDNQCAEGYHCCKSNLEFKCKKQYKQLWPKIFSSFEVGVDASGLLFFCRIHLGAPIRHRVLGSILSCLEVDTLSTDLVVDPTDGKKEGEDCKWDSECALQLHCCWEVGDPYCRKIQVLGCLADEV